MGSCLLPVVCLADIPDTVVENVLAGDWEGAHAALTADDSHATDPVARLLCAHACLATSRNNAALLLFLSVDGADAKAWEAWTGSLTAKHADSPIVQYLHGDALARMGDLQAAEASLTRALTQDAEMGLAWVARGAARVLLGREDEAYVDLFRATQAEPGLADTHASLGCLRVMEEDAQGALDAFNEALRIDPSFALAYNGRGCAHYGLGKPDEASLDFQMAEQLSPALVVTAANQGLVLALVARKVDEKVPPLEKPGTTLELRSGQVPDFDAMEAGDVQAFVDRCGGYQTAYRMIADWQDGVRRDMDARTQNYDGKVRAVEQTALFIEMTKVALTAPTVVAATAAGGPAGGLAVLAWESAKHGVSTTIDNPAANIGLAGLGMTHRLMVDLDPAQAVLGAVQQFGTSPLLENFHAANTLATLEDGARLLHGDALKRVAVEGAMVPHLRDGAPPPVVPDLPRVVTDTLKRVTFSSDQPWSQMRDLMKEIGPTALDGRPVAIVGQDPVRSFAFERMLHNRGIPTVTTPAVDAGQLADLGDLLRPTAVVGFHYDLDDTARKVIAPVWPDDHGPGGAAALARPTFPTINDDRTFTFPGSDGSPVRLPLPTGFDRPGASFDWGQPFTPKGDVGGVRTSDLEWVFVDKGDWPVVTFFTLAYTPLEAEGGPE